MWSTYGADGLPADQINLQQTSLSVCESRCLWNNAANVSGSTTTLRSKSSGICHPQWLPFLERAMSVNTVFKSASCFFSIQRAALYHQSAVVCLAEVCVCVFDLVYRSAGVKIKVYRITNQFNLDTQAPFYSSSCILNLTQDVSVVLQ